MRLLKGWCAPLVFYSLVAAISLLLASCGGNSSSTPSSGIGSGSSVANTQPIEVNSGPANNYTNGLYTSVTICVPGTSTCQTIPNVLVDTGSYGLRLLSSEVTLSLPAITDNSNSNVLQECVSFADGSYVWGPVVSADIQMAGEKGSQVPIQLISASPQYAVPSACANGGPADNTVATLGANGILGIGVFAQDCGGLCTSASTMPSPAPYYLCPTTGTVCNVAVVPLAYQLQNPVWMFPQDNNGLLISLPSIPETGAPSASGSLIFGIGTQSDNALGNAQIYTTDGSGNYHVTYGGTDYSNSFIDSGSNALYFLDAATLGITECTDNSGSPTGWYCPSITQQYTVTTTGLNQTSSQVQFNIANADTLFAANGGQNYAFNNLGGDSGTGPSSDYVDFGLPFFFGRNVFIGIEGQASPTGVNGPYWAY